MLLVSVESPTEQAMENVKRQNNVALRLLAFILVISSATFLVYFTVCIEQLKYQITNHQNDIKYLMDELKEINKYVNRTGRVIPYSVEEKVISSSTAENISNDIDLSTFLHSRSKRAPGRNHDTVEFENPEGRNRKKQRKNQKNKKSKNRKNKNNGKNRKKNRDRGNKYEEGEVEETPKRTNEVTVIHMAIDPKRSEPNNPDIKTPKQDTVIPFWKLSDDDFNYKQEFAKFNGNGTVTIKKSGIYQIYSQMTYFDRTGRWSHLVDVGGRPFIKCLASEWGIEVDPHTKLYYNTVHQCYTSAVKQITEGQIVSIKSMYEDRVIHADEEMTFWGIIWIS